jgi:hypothetical protein
VWVPKEKSVLTPLGMENPSSSNQWRGRKSYS